MLLSSLVIEFVGAAQSPQTHPWSQNQLRTTEDAVALAEKHGATFPDEFRIVLTDDLPAGAWAAYALPVHTFANDMWSWGRFLNAYDEIPIRVRREVHESDEAIVCVYSHESFELTALRELLPDASSTMPTQQLRDLVAPGISGNLHCRAWDVGDRRVRAMRGDP